MLGASSIILGIHVLAGMLALLTGGVAILSRKGSSLHLTTGRYYVISMTLVVVTAVPLAVVIESWFLLTIAGFTGYLLFAGVRVIPRRRSIGEGAKRLDRVGHGAMIIAGGGMVVAGMLAGISRSGELGSVLVVFGGIGGGLAVRELRTLRKPIAEQIPWTNRHIGFMGGAYISTVTATVTVNLTMLPPFARWLTPTLIGVPWIIYATRKYDSRFRQPDRRTALRPTPIATNEHDGD